MFWNKFKKHDTECVERAREGRVQRLATVLSSDASALAARCPLPTSPRSRIGVITVNDFFTKILHCQRGMFGDAVFELVDTEDNEKIEFGEFVQATCTYCMFEPPEVLKFCFYIFDKDKNGYIDQDELTMFIEQLHQEKLQGNLASALESLDYNQDGKFEFHEFKQMHKQFPQVLYPAFRLQQIMMDNICGSTWWNKKKGRLAMEKEEAIRKDREERIAQARKLEVARQKQIKKHMGALKYYLMPHKRAKYDELYPPAKPGRR